jgi:hypothetical protein
MANVDSLKTAFRDLSQEEAFRLLIGIRANRRNVVQARTTKKRSATSVKVGKKKAGKKKDISSLIQAMSPEQARQLLTQLKQSTKI